MRLFYSKWLITLFSIAIILSSGILSGCTSSTHKAPVVEAPYIKLPPKGYYRARKGDTLYAIAWSYNLDYRVLAKYNQLSYPYAIHPGQVLRVDFKKTPQTIKSVKNIPAPSVRMKEPPSHPVYGWSWPTRGTLIATFNPAKGKKGIDLAGKAGTPIRAAAAGEVVYCGSGLPAYGQMIILKHNTEYFSAYAHNQKLLVKEGQTVNKMQVIALMGNSGADRTLLHFEIRKSGKPVNPLALLPRD